MTTARPNPAPRRGPAFTLAEVVVSLMVLAVVVVAAGAALTVADAGAGVGAQRSLAQAGAADASAQVADDLNVAISFTERTATSTTFTVPDRVSLGAPNTVRYSWTGTAGGAVTRQFNGGTAVPVLAAADAFGLAYQTRTYGPAADAAFTLPTWGNLLSPTYTTYNLTSTAWAAQVVVPVLPAGTATYTITRVQLPLKSSGPADGVLAVRITTATASGTPTTTVLGTSVVFEAQLSNTVFELVDVPFANVSGLTPGTSYCMTVGYLFGTGTVAGLQYVANTPSGANGVPMSTSANAGSTWTVGPTTVFQPFNICGTVP